LGILLTCPQGRYERAVNEILMAARQWQATHVAVRNLASIPLPDEEELRTLRDAATYATKLPKDEANTPEWQAAIQALMLVAEHGGDDG
jgi:hypothetical protein